MPALIGSSEKFRAVLDAINWVVPVDSAVLIRGGPRCTSA